MKKALFTLLAIFLFLNACSNPVKGEKKLVWVKGISYGFANNAQKANLDSKNSMGGYLVGVKYVLLEDKVQVTTEPFQSSLSPTADMNLMKSGELKNGLYFQQFPVSAQVYLPARLPKLIKGTIAVKETGSYYYPMINQVLKDQYGSPLKEKKGIIYINSLNYIENDTKNDTAKWGIIQYSLYVVED